MSKIESKTILIQYIKSSYINFIQIKFFILYLKRKYMLSVLFFTINFWLTIVSTIVGLILCLLTIFIVITHRECRNFTNVLTCNTCVAVTLYFIYRIIDSIYGLRQDWQYHQPACVFRAYCALTLCAALCYSFSIQAISRLFFAVFYKHKYLLTWRTHWILIIVNWLVSIIISSEPFFFDNGFGLEIESRICVVTPKIVSISMYVVVTVFLIPLNIVTIIYGTILHRVRQSTRRVAAVGSNVITSRSQVTAPAPNGKRELKLMQNLSVQTTIISLGGILYLILVIWHATQEHSLPESFYLLAITLISIFTAFMMIAFFLMNKVVKKIALSYIIRNAPIHTDQSMTRQPIKRANVH